MANMKKIAPKKPTVSRSPSKGVKTPMPKIGNTPSAKRLLPKDTNAKPSPRQLMSKQLTGPAAVAALQKRVSPSGVKKAEMDAKKATNKKYPGLYKKSK